MEEASFYRQDSSKKVACLLCPHYCQIVDGKNGLCRVRGNRNGILYALNYGQIISAASDPIEKKPLYHYYPGAATLSIGSVGCNLHCLHCQNWQISQCGPEIDERSLQAMSPATAVAETCARGAEILVFTYNEPSLWFEYIRDCAEFAKPQQVKLVMVTSGMINPQPLQELLTVIDAYRVDIKGFSHDFYKDLAGFDVLDQVLANTKAAYQAGVHVEVVTNLIPGWNDDEVQLRGLAGWIRDELSAEIPWHITRYHPCHRMSAPMTPMESLQRGFQIGREVGLKHIYLGNVAAHASDNTYCAGCGELLIKRHGYSVVNNRIVAGRCPDCNFNVGCYRG